MKLEYEKLRLKREVEELPKVNFSIWLCIALIQLFIFMSHNHA